MRDAKYYLACRCLKILAKMRDTVKQADFDKQRKIASREAKFSEITKYKTFHQYYCTFYIVSVNFSL